MIYLFLFKAVSFVTYKTDIHFLPPEGKHMTKDTTHSSQLTDDVASNSPKQHNFSELEKCLSAPPLLLDEEYENFENFLELLVKDIDPQGAVEFIYLRDFAIYTFEIGRMRNYRNYLTLLAEPEAVLSLSKSIGNSKFKASLAGQDWAQRAHQASQNVNFYLNSEELNQIPLEAQSFAVIIDQLEKVERMIASAEARRLSLIREIDRRHQALKERLQKTIKNEDGSYSFKPNADEIHSDVRRSLS